MSASDVKIAFEAVIGDHPEMFWLETGYSSKYLANGQCVEIDLNITVRQMIWRAQSKDLMRRHRI